MTRRLYLALVSFSCAILSFATADRANANCYTIRNDTNSNLQLGFQYNVPMGNGSPVSATVNPHAQYPLDGQPWCWNGTGSWAATVSLTGAGHLHGPTGQLYHGGLRFGDGTAFAPSGTYSMSLP